MWRILHAQFVRNISPRPDVNLTQESLIYQLRNNSEFKSKLKPMETIRISPDEEIIYKDFKEGNSVQVRVTVGPSDKDEFVKGKTVRVVHGNFEDKGRIVSDPLIIGHRFEGEDLTISLIVEKV
jgi:hypothetical protein